jgi:hypothetical protein
VGQSNNAVDGHASLSAPLVRWMGAEPAEDADGRRLVLMTVGDGDPSTAQHIAVDHSAGHKIVLDVLAVLEKHGCPWATYVRDVLDKLDLEDHHAADAAGDTDEDDDSASDDGDDDDEDDDG